MFTSRRGPALSFRFFGTPVRIGPTFPLAIVVLPLVFGGRLAQEPFLLAGWALLVTISVLVHEGGHVTALRIFGFTPEVSLNAMGGLTSTTENVHITPRQSIIVSVSGPLAAIVLGLTIHAGLTPIQGETVRWIITASWFVNIGWSFFNLLPVMPLDGGHIMRELVEITSRRRDRTVAWLIMGVLAIAVLLRVLAGSRFGLWIALAFIALAATNIRYFAITDRQRRLQAIDMAHADLMEGDLLGGLRTLVPIVQSEEHVLLSSEAYTTLAWALLHERRYDELCRLDPDRFHVNHRELLVGATSWFQGDVGSSITMVSHALGSGPVEPPATYFDRVFGRLGEIDRLAQHIGSLPTEASVRAAQRLRKGLVTPALA